MKTAEDGKTHSCNKCKETKSVEHFYKASWCTGGYRPTCVGCRHGDRLKREYGVDLEWFKEASKNGCELCPVINRTRRFNVDHDHSNGKVRGVLCSQCNHAIAKYFDDKVMFDKVMAYLERSK